MGGGVPNTRDRARQPASRREPLFAFCYCFVFVFLTNKLRLVSCT